MRTDWSLFQRREMKPIFYDPDYESERLFRQAPSRSYSMDLRPDDDIEMAPTRQEMVQVRGNRLEPKAMPEVTARELWEAKEPVLFHGWLRAACRDAPTEWFYPPRGGHGRRTAEALRLCAGCPVRDECRRHGSKRGRREAGGIWGGETDAQRRARRREEAADAGA